ncbi:Hypothetical protein D9617_34g041050 [Elsinoe fawcettii]|nr:Hypothetical protein D9617_34g041050 [Elsinoe fawcettii]
MADRCAVCSQPGKISCKDCEDFPSSDLKQSNTTWYCSEACQQQDEHAHGLACEAAYQRKMMLLISESLFEAILEYRKLTFDLPLTGQIEREGNTMRFYTASRLEQWGRLGPLCPLPVSFDRHSKEEQHRILLWQMCSETAFVVEPLLWPMLEGLVTTEDSILIRDLDARDIACKVVNMLDGKERVTNLGHVVVEIRLECGQSFVLDLTGEQFGWHELVVPKDEYFPSRVQNKMSSETTQVFAGRYAVSKQCDKRQQLYHDLLKEWVVAFLQRLPCPATLDDQPNNPQKMSRWLAHFLVEFKSTVRDQADRIQFGSAI